RANSNGQPSGIIAEREAEIPIYESASGRGTLTQKTLKNALPRVPSRGGKLALLQPPKQAEHAAAGRNTIPPMKRVRIGNGCGFWGDNLDAPIRLAASGKLDYLTLEYLAELTMSILAVQKAKDANAGFATDFIDVLGQLAPTLKDQSKLKIVTNAGGMN